MGGESKNRKQQRLLPVSRSSDYLQKGYFAELVCRWSASDRSDGPYLSLENHMR